jgi:hypothetical protein
VSAGLGEIGVNKQQAKRARVVAYVCFGLATVNISIYVAKSLFATDSDPSPALWITGMAMLMPAVSGSRWPRKHRKNDLVACRRSGRCT